MTDHLDLLQSIAVSDIVSSATLAALVSMLTRKGILSVDEEREIFEQALLMLEAAQAKTPEMRGIYVAAREIIEDHLRPNGCPSS
jgi:hypothetical protein